MHTHGIRAVGEVYTGCIRKYHKLHKKRQHDFSQDFRRRYGLIHAQHRRLFFCLVLEFYERRNMQDCHSTGDPGNASTKAEEFESDADDTEDLRTLMHHYMITAADEDEELNKKKKVKWAEDVALSTTVSQHGESSDGSSLRRVSFSLAGAWYEAACNPDSQSEESSTRLFSFPWIVADVIARGLTES